MKAPREYRRTEQPAAPRQRWAMFSALRYPNYRRYWIAQFPSVLGQNMQYVAVAWLVLQLTNSPLMLGVTGLVQTVPNVALSFVGGAVADRMDRKRLLILTQGAQALLFFGLGTLIAADLVELWEVFGVAFLLGCVRSFDQPSRQALLPMVIPREEIPNAVPLGNLVWNGTRLVGPAMAGLLISTVGVGATYYCAGTGFVIAILFFSRLQVDRSMQSPARRGLLSNILEGMEYLRAHDVVRALIGLTFFNSVFGMSYTLMMPVFARDILHVGSQGFGFLETAAGVGSLVGTFGVAALARSTRRGRQVLVGAAIYGTLIVGLSYSSVYVLSLGVLFLMGIASQVYMTTVNTSLQLTVPEDFRGRVMGIWGLTYSLMPLGGTITGTMAEYIGAPNALAIGGALVALMAVIVAATQPRVRNL